MLWQFILLRSPKLTAEYINQRTRSRLRDTVILCSHSLQPVSLIHRSYLGEHVFLRNPKQTQTCATQQHQDTQQRFNSCGCGIHEVMPESHLSQWWIWWDLVPANVCLKPDPSNPFPVTGPSCSHLSFAFFKGNKCTDSSTRKSRIWPSESSLQFCLTCKALPSQGISFCHPLADTVSIKISC